MLVILLVNLDLAAGLVNGSQGVITGFEAYDPSKLPKITKSNRAGKEDDKDRLVLPSGQILGGEYASIKDPTSSLL